jgi:RES domain-containing protein
LADPGWPNPLDVTFSERHGGRWNAPGSFGALYLSRTVRMARLQVAHKLAGQPYGVEDLDPAAQHDLVLVRVEPADWLDCCSDPGLAAVGLPPSYPTDEHGDRVTWETCQAVGARAHSSGRPGLACRSAAIGATSDDEELAVLDTSTDVVGQVAREAFADWYWPAPAS